MTTIRRATEAAPRPRILVLFDPRGAFSAVKARPLWGLTLAALLAMALLPPIAYLSKADLTAVVKKELVKSGRLEQMPAEQREVALTQGPKFMKVALPVGALVKRSGWIVLCALLGWALLRSTTAELRLGACLGAAALGAAPFAVHDVVVMATFLAKDLDTLDAQNAVLSNPAAWFDLDTGHSALGALLRGVDFFALWACGLVGVGLSTVAAKRGALPYIAPFGLHTASTLLGVLSAAIAG